MARTTTSPGLATAAPPSAADRGKRLVIALGSLGHAVTQAIADEIGSSPTGNVPLLVLCELSMRGPLRPRDLVEATHLTSGGLTKVLDQLEAQGLIAREFGTVAEDRRASITSLTPAGTEVVDRIGEITARVIDEHRPLLQGLAGLVEP